MLDMSRRMRTVERVIIAVFTGFAVLAIPTCGWGLLGASLLTVVVCSLESRVSRHRRPEYLLLLLFEFVELAIGAGIVGSSGPRILLLPLLAVPPLLCGVVWPGRGVALATASGAVMMVVVGFAVDASGVIHTPPLLIAPLAVLVSMAIVASAARSADVSSRATAVVDRLTGLLNRSALLSRATALAHQAGLHGEPVAVLVVDVDRFKEVNDRHGHVKGDAILAAVAKRLRTAVGPNESVYRFGGEEFVILAPGADPGGGAALAERLRQVVRRQPVEGIAVTISIGVSGSLRQEPFEFQRLFYAADAALYVAKAQGRDRVCVVGRDDREPPEAAVSRPSTAGDSQPELVHERRANRRASVPAVSLNSDIVDTGRLEQRIARYQAETGSWILPDQEARAHMLDFLSRVRKVRIVAYGVVFLAILSGGPYYGWMPVLCPFVSAMALSIPILRAERMRRPEFPVCAAIVASFVVNALGFAFAHGSPLLALPMLVVPVFAWSPVFPPRCIAVAAIIEAVLIVLVGRLIGGPAVFTEPVALGVPLALLTAAVLIGSVLGRSTIDHRSAAVVDELTGLLNRQALEARVTEIGHRVLHSGEPVGVVVGDIDCFKDVNDTHGHRSGDAVLREVAYRIRSNLRAFESAYRIGGEEFVVLLTGVRARDAALIAERLRRVVCEEPINGLPVTISFGVSATAPGQELDYDALFKRADAALYRAKCSGRDNVCVAASAEVDSDTQISAAA